MEHDDIMHNAAPGMILALASLLSFVLNISTKQSLLDLNNILSRKPQRTSALLHSTAAAVSERENAAQVSAVHALWQLLCHYDTLWKCLRYHASSQLQTFTTKRVHGMQVTVPLTSVCVCGGCLAHQKNKHRVEHRKPRLFLSHRHHQTNLIRSDALRKNH